MSAAERVRLHRIRRRKGMQCVWVRLRNRDVDTLIAKGYLEPQSRNDRALLRRAADGFLADMLYQARGGMIE
jgi:hypothetical protein